MKLLKILNDHFEEYLLVLLMVLDVTIVFLQVVTRYVFKSPLAWSEEIARYMFIWLVWLGAAYATKNNKNIKIDVLSRNFKGTFKIVSDIINTILFIGLMVFMLYTTSVVTSTVYSSHSIATGSHMPMWFAWFALPLSMALMLFRYIQNLVLEHRAAKKEEAAK